MSTHTVYAILEVGLEEPEMSSGLEDGRAP